MNSAGTATCLVLQHVEPEGPYTLAEALADAGIVLHICRVYAGDPVPPDAARLDGLVVMGGPMSATSDDAFPTRTAEVALIADAIARGVPVLGICLGAQLLALAGGGEVLAGAAGPEIGWGPVQMTDEARDDALLGAASTELTVLHWHGDTFTLPPAAVRLAGSRVYAQQAFRLGTAWGLQFHVEVDETAVKVFATEFEDEARSAGADPQQIVDASAAALEALVPVRAAAFAAFADLVRRRQV